MDFGLKMEGKQTHDAAHDNKRESSVYILKMNHTPYNLSQSKMCLKKAMVHLCLLCSTK